MQKKFITIAVIIILLVVVIILQQTAKTYKGSQEQEITDARSTETTFKPDAYTDTYTVDTQASTVTWEGRGVGKKHTGTLPVSGSLSFLNNIPTSTLSFDLGNLKSTDENSTGGEQLVKHLQSPDFFDVVNYPTATLVLKSLTPTTPKENGDTNNATVEALLTIKEKEVTVNFPVEITAINDAEMHIRGTVVIDRTLWGITFNSSSFIKDIGDAAIANEILITFDIIARK